MMKRERFHWKNYDVLHGRIEDMFEDISRSIDCRELGDTVKEEELKAMIDEFDLDGDGESKRRMNLCEGNSIGIF